MLTVAQCHNAKPLCNEAAYTNARTQSCAHRHQHAHTTPNAHFFLLQRPCVGMVIEGWQLADRLQTLFFDIKRFSSESHFHAFSLSRSRAHAEHTRTSVPANTTTLISSDLTAKTERLWRSNTARRARTHRRIPKHWKVNTISSAIVEMRFVRCVDTFPVWFENDSKYFFPLLRHRWSTAIFSANRWRTYALAIATHEECAQRSAGAFWRVYRWGHWMNYSK